MTDVTCSHLEAIATVKHAKRRECAECVKIDAQWVHLRICQQCGTTLCCDDSLNQHATKHARASGHPVIASAEPGSVGCTAIRMTRSLSTKGAVDAI